MSTHRRVVLVFCYAFALVFGVVAPHRAAAAPEAPRIECDVSIPCSVEEAWTAWTTEDGLRAFLARSAYVVLEKGGAYAINLGGANSEGRPDPNGPRIISLDFQKELSFEWVIPLPRAAGRDPKTVVTIRIEAISARRTRVRLEHTGWLPGEEKSEAFAYSKKAWKVVLGRLRSTLAAESGGPAPPVAIEMAGIRGTFGRDSRHEPDTLEPSTWRPRENPRHPRRHAALFGVRLDPEG